MMLYRENMEAILDVANDYRAGEKRPAQTDSVKNSWKEGPELWSSASGLTRELRRKSLKQCYSDDGRDQKV